MELNLRLEKLNLISEKVNLGMIAIVICLLLLLIGLQGCPECVTPIPSTIEGSDIIFTGQALNSSKPGIFGIKDNGANLLEIIDYGVIFSPITDNKKVVFWNKRPDDEDNITIYDFQKAIGERTFPLVAQGDFPIINYPIVSKDGSHYAFFTDKSEIFVSKGDNIWNKGNYDICPKTLPTFSPNANFLAFYVGDSLDAPLRINIVDSDDPANVLNFKELSFGIKGLKGEAQLDWSHQDFIVYNYSKSDNIDYIGIWNLAKPAESYEIEVVGIGAYNPTISPDGLKFAFTTKSGDLWLRNTKDDPAHPGWEQITEIDTLLEYNMYPRWSANGEKIIYTKFFVNNKNKYSGNLEIIDLNAKNLKSKVLSNNVYRAFWFNK